MCDCELTEWFVCDGKQYLLCLSTTMCVLTEWFVCNGKQYLLCSSTTFVCTYSRTSDS